MFGVIAGVLSSIIVVFASPFSKILWWALIFPLFDHLEMLKIGDLIPAVTFGRVFILALISAHLLKARPENRITHEDYRRIQQAMLAMAIIFIIEIYIKYRPKDGTRQLISFFESFLMPFLMYGFARYYVRNRDSAERIFTVLMLSGIWVSFMGVYEQLTHVDLVPYVPLGYSDALMTGLRGFGSSVRANGPFMTPEAYGGTLSIIWFVVLYKLRTAPNTLRERTPLFLCLIIISGGVLACMFRSIWLGLIMGFLVHLALSPNRGTRAARWIMIGVLMLAAFFAVQKDSGLMKDFLQGRLFYKESMYSRLGAYMIAWRAFLENALIGLGYGGFQYYASHVNLASRVTFRGIWAANQAHNMLLSILAENGIVGLLPFAALTIAVVKQIARTWREADSQYSREWATSMAGICVAFLLPWLFATSGYYKAINNLFYLLLGVTSRSGASAHENGRIREVPALAATVRR